MSFYRANPNPNILAREAAVGKACDQGRFFIVETAGQIVAVSGLFPVARTPFFEVGGTLVAGPWQGFGIQDLFFLVRLAAIAITEGETARISTVIDPNNTQSKKNALKGGFEAWPAPIPELLEECDPAPGRDGCKKKAGLPAGAACCSDYYLLTRTALNAAINRLLSDTKTTNVLTRKRSGTGDQVEITVECRFVTDAARREILAEFAASGL